MHAATPIVLTFALSVTALAQPAPVSDLPTHRINERAERPVDPGADAKIAAANKEATDKLAERLAEVKWFDRELIDAVDALRDMTGAKIFVNWHALEQAGVDRHEPVSLHKKDVKLSRAIDLLLAQVAPEGKPLDWKVEDGTIVISTRNELAGHDVLTRVYDVRDLLRLSNDADRQRHVDELLKFVMDQVGAGSWKERGGSAGAIRELQGQLIVTQTPQNHRQLLKLLMGLRDWLPRPAAADHPQLENFPLVR